jgi:hypothetical protein
MGKKVKQCPCQALTCPGWLRPRTIKTHLRKQRLETFVKRVAGVEVEDDTEEGSELHVGGESPATDSDFSEPHAAFVPTQSFLEKYSGTMVGQRWPFPVVVDMIVHLVFMIRHGISYLASQDLLELTRCFVPENVEHPNFSQLQQLIELLAPEAVAISLCRNECVSFLNAPSFIRGSPQRQFRDENSVRNVCNHD